MIGGTGNLGGRVVEALVARGHPVRALVRDGTDPALVRARGAEPVPGNLLDPASPRSALAGARAVVTTAIGYLNRRKGDTLATEVGTPLVVFTQHPRRRRGHRGPTFPPEGRDRALPR